jgi:hypothetical protein
MMKKFLATVIIILVSLASYAGGAPQLKTEKAPMKIRKRNARPDVPGTMLIELGWNFLQNKDIDLDINSFGSRTLNLTYLYDIRIGKSKFYFLPGISVGLDRYKFDKNITLVETLDANGDEIIQADTLSFTSVKKSLLVANYLDIPFEIRFIANPEDSKRSFKVGVGFKVGVLMSSHTKVKYDDAGDTIKEKIKDTYGLSKFRYGVVGRIGIGGFNVFYYQNLTTLFESGKGPLKTGLNNVTVGFSFTGF